MRRRDFIKAIAGALAGLQSLARAQTGSTVIGFLHAGAREESASRVESFLRGLSETGYHEARNVTIEYRWAKGNYDLLPKMAAEWLREHVSVLAALTTPAALAAKVTTATTPIVFTTGGDPVKVGLVATLNQPGRN